MNDLLNEIRSAFANLQRGESAPLEGVGEFSATAYRESGGFGVRIDYTGEEYIVNFANAQLRTEGASKPEILMLESTDEKFRNEFAVICAEFVEPGRDGARRSSLLADPEQWWNTWKNLLGNVASERSPHAILGELLTYEALLGNGKEPVWKGPESASHDLQCDSEDYEVKSTISKTGTTVEISSQFQLASTGERPLFLAFWRFEPRSGGVSINEVVKRLSKLGVDIDQTEKKLNRMGFASGTPERKITYEVLESCKYLIDNSFPRITEDAFAGGSFPRGVVKITYTVDLQAVSPLPFPE